MDLSDWECCRVAWYSLLTVSEGSSKCYQGSGDSRSDRVSDADAAKESR
jgi:hypothetical protein